MIGNMYFTVISSDSEFGMVIFFRHALYYMLQIQKLVPLDIITIQFF